jgi:hypothetical protein
MTQEHTITPPDDQIMLWCKQWNCTKEPGPIHKWLAIQAARWGADMELEACCSWADATGWCGAGDMLRDARRSKPPSLKEQALEVVTGLEKRWDLQCDLTLLRRALEQLND